MKSVHSFKHTITTLNFSLVDRHPRLPRPTAILFVRLKTSLSSTGISCSSQILTALLMNHLTSTLHSYVDLVDKSYKRFYLVDAILQKQTFLLKIFLCAIGLPRNFLSKL